MSSGPKTLVDFSNGWSLKSWEYDNAPIELHGPRDFVMQIEADGDLSVEWNEGSRIGSVSRNVPRHVLEAFLGWTRKP